MITSTLVDSARPSEFVKTEPVDTKETRDDKLKEACARFEGMFLEIMMKTMRKATEESSFIKKNNGEKIFTEMLDQQYVDLASKNDSTGLGETLYNYIKDTSPEYRENGNIFPMQNLPTDSSAFLELRSIK